MSYSRWSNSYWYTYWYTLPKEITENRNNAVFSIAGVCSFSAEVLRENMDKCISLVHVKEPEATAEQLEELRGYMNKFLDDVEEENMYR